MCNEEKITFMELQILANDLEANGIEMELFSINKLINITQVSNEYEMYRRTKNEVLTPIQYLEKNYLKAISLIKDSKKLARGLDESLNINQEIYYIGNSPVVHALNIINYLEY